MYDQSHADVYASGCVAYEVLAGSVLFGGDSVKEVLDQHFSMQPAADRLAMMTRDRKLAPLAELSRATLSREPTRRPSAARLRAGFKAIAHDLVNAPWPLTVP